MNEIKTVNIVLFYFGFMSIQTHTQMHDVLKDILKQKSVNFQIGKMLLNRDL